MASTKSPKVTSLTENVTNNLKAIRAKRGLSQAAFAELLGVSTSYVSMLERGERTLPLPAVEAFAKALKLPALTILIPNPKL